MEAAADLFTELEDGGIGDVVEDAEAFFAAAEDALVGEGLEVARDIGLSGAEELDQLGHIFFAGLQGDEQFEAVGFAEDPESGGDEVEGGFAEGGTFHGRQGEVTPRG